MSDSTLPTAAGNADERDTDCNSASKINTDCCQDRRPSSDKWSKSAAATKAEAAIVETDYNEGEVREVLLVNLPAVRISQFCQILLFCLV